MSHSFPKVPSHNIGDELWFLITLMIWSLFNWCTLFLNLVDLILEVQASDYHSVWQMIVRRSYPSSKLQCKNKSGVGRKKCPILLVTRSCAIKMIQSYCRCLMWLFCTFTHWGDSFIRALFSEEKLSYILKPRPNIEKNRWNLTLF